MDNLQTPLNPQAPRAQSTPIPGQPLQSQGMPTGQDPATMPGQEFATPEERQQLLQLIEQTKDKMANIRTMEFTSANAEEAARIDAMRQLFSMMQSAGVDLSSVESVNQFLQKIKSANPNMAADFEEALDRLLGDESMVAQSELENETLPEDIRGLDGGSAIMA